MSWQDFYRLINEQNTDITAWMSAIQANPNTPEDALKVALLQMIQSEDGAMLEKLTKVVIGMVRNADGLLDALIEQEEFPAPLNSEPVAVMGVDDPRENHTSEGVIPDLWVADLFEDDIEDYMAEHAASGRLPGGTVSGGNGGVPPTLPALPI